MSKSRDIAHLNGKIPMQVPIIGQQQRQPGPPPPPMFRLDDDVLVEDFVPTQDNVLIRRVERVEKVGSIVMAQVGESKVIWAQVIAVGPGRVSDVNHRNIKPQVEPGDIVVFTPAYSPPVWLNCKTEELMLIRDHDIRVKIKRGSFQPAVNPDMVGVAESTPAPESTSSIITEP